MPKKAKKAKNTGDDGGRSASGRRALMEVRFPSEERYLHMVHELTKQFATMTGFEGVEAEKIALAVDEATTNVIQHAYRGEPGHDIEVHFDTKDERLSIIILHDGEPLDDVPVPAFDLDELVAERRKGGLGLAIMRQMMDEVEHKTAADGQKMCVLVRYKQRASGKR